jgi:hypothetical protein
VRYIRKGSIHAQERIIQRCSHAPTLSGWRSVVIDIKNNADAAARIKSDANPVAGGSSFGTKTHLLLLLPSLFLIVNLFLYILCCWMLFTAAEHELVAHI